MVEEERKGCYAPVFGGNSACACVVLDIVYTVAIVAIIIPALFSKKIMCHVKRYYFRMTHCIKGNSDPNIQL